MSLKCCWIQIGNQSTCTPSGRQLWKCMGTLGGRAAPCTADKIRSIIGFVQFLKLLLLGMCQWAPQYEICGLGTRSFQAPP